MDYNILLGVVGFFLAIAFIIFFSRRIIKKNKRIKEDIPEEVLDDFNKAENLIDQSKGKKTAQEILFNLWKEKNEIANEDIRELKKEIIEQEVKPKKQKLSLKRLFK